ncbi:hypothetical protein ACU61A_37415 [Pseudonocardia sichuanensis]|uniref:Uncharacterized protein n=1 Tax=Pseudonocardia kunmingensis TaxID=630975 RepID=A0A543D9G9_9PSEU|nr:hypothetical protein [Pseudonocardia kunmingensis]TQM05984.1 hypothetical protein FB558_6212 [Pseudonocardia kunmingensis]
MDGTHDGRRRPERPARSEPHAQRAEVTALLTRRRRAAGTGRHAGDDPPALVADIHTLDGPDADRLALQQARVIKEVIAWLAYIAPRDAPDRAA